MRWCRGRVRGDGLQAGPALEAIAWPTAEFPNPTDDNDKHDFIHAVRSHRRTIKNQSNALVAEYTYNGLGYRIGWHFDVTGSGGGSPDGAVDANDPWYFFAYDERWREIGTYRSTDSDPKERFVYHAAGLDGLGGSSYIDSVMLRDRDSSTAWKSASDGVLESRTFPCQNWRADVSAVIDAAGQMVEWVKYRAYGAPFGLPAGDTDSDGDKDSTDEATVSGWSGGYDVRADLDLDGDIDATDDFLCSALQSMNQGRAALSRSDVENRKGYAGYENSYEITRFSHVRHRVLDAELGRWMTRDPAGYLDGASLFGFIGANPVAHRDGTGLLWCNGQTCQPPPSCSDGILCKPLPPTPISPPPGTGACQRESHDATCSVQCTFVSPGALGVSVCGSINGPICCVCDRSICNYYPSLECTGIPGITPRTSVPIEPTTPALAVIMECVADHEMAHLALCDDDVGRDRDVVGVSLAPGMTRWMSPAQVAELLESLGRHFHVHRHGVDLAMTLDLDDPTAPPLRAWAELGFNRVSISLSAIAGSERPAAEVARHVERARNAGFANLRVEVPYGLPGQSAEAFEALLAAVLAAEPERVGLRHCPAPEHDEQVAESPARLQAHARMLIAGADALEAAGYLHVGVDLFARPNDPLVVAQRRQRLHRDALGFGAHGATHLVGFGVGAISQLGGCHAQNPLDLATWEARIDQGKRAVQRGIDLCPDDDVRAELLQRILCYGRIDTRQLEHHHHIRFREYFADDLLRLAPLFEAGSLRWDADAIVLDRCARLASRSIASQFDPRSAASDCPG